MLLDHIRNIRPNRQKECDVYSADLRQDNVLGVSLALLGDGVHEGLGGEAGRLGGRQALSHAVHIHILGKGFLHKNDNGS